jgi:hypothetical protein
LHFVTVNLKRTDLIPEFPNGGERQDVRRQVIDEFACASGRVSSLSSRFLRESSYSVAVDTNERGRDARCGAMEHLREYFVTVCRFVPGPQRDLDRFNQLQALNTERLRLTN